MTTTFKKSAIAALAALTLSTAMLAAAGSAEARPRHRGVGIGLGIVGALAVGGLIAASQRPAYAESAYGYDEPAPECELVERLNRHGEIVGYRQVCSVY